VTRKTPSLRIALSAALVLALALALVPAALASKGGGGGGGKPGGGGSAGSNSISLVLLNSSDGLPHWGQQVTFNVSTTATEPFVSVTCSRNGSAVYSASAGFFAGYLWPWEQNFTLKSNYWTSGAADCTATLYYYDGHRTRNLMSLAFHVYA
jgi:hypothetical protein